MIHFTRRHARRAAAFAAALLLVCLWAVTALADTIVGSEYSEGLITYKNSKNKYGYMDVNGNVVIKAGKFISASNFHNGLAVVQISSGGIARSQYIDHSGKVVIKNIDTKTRHYGFRAWQGDYAIVEVWKINRKPLSIDKIGVNYINAKGKLISDEDFLYAGPFSEGYALVGTGYLPYSTSSFVSSSNEKGETLSISTFSGNTAKNAASKYFYIDMQGERLGSLTWDFGRTFSEGYAAVAIAGANGSYLWGFIDSTGNLAVGPQWASVADFRNGMAVVSDGSKFGFINTAGEVVVPCEWDEARAFASNGLAAVRAGDVWGYINTAGEVVIDPVYASAGFFEQGVAFVKNGAGWGMIDETGALLAEPIYRSLNMIGQTGRIAAMEWDAPMIVNEHGKIVSVVLVNGEVPTEEQAAQYPDGTPCTYVSVPLSNGMTMGVIRDQSGRQISMNLYGDKGSEFTIRKGSGKTILLDMQGGRVGNGEWDGIAHGVYSSSCIGVLSNNLYGLIDYDGNYILTPRFSRLTPFANGEALFYIGDNAALIDEEGRSVLPVIKKGSPKDDVKRLQQALKDQGFYSGKINGSVDKKTTAAIKAAQESFGMEQTGVADSAFQYMLFGE